MLGHPGRNDVGGKLKPYLGDANACVILRLVLENPGITPADLTRRSQFDKTVVEGYLNEMILNGFVIVEKEGASPGYYIAETAKAAVADHLPLNYQCPGMMRE
jgi:predicted transcriptional regulator